VFVSTEDASDMNKFATNCLQAFYEGLERAIGIQDYSQALRN